MSPEQCDAIPAYCSSSYLPGFLLFLAVVAAPAWLPMLFFWVKDRAFPAFMRWYRA